MDEGTLLILRGLNCTITKVIEEDMTPLDIAHQIEGLIGAIQKEGKRSTELIQAKADACRVYDKAIAVRSVELRAEGVPATLIDKQSKGDASQLLSEKIVAEESLKAHFCRIDYLKAQLNGFQSVNRHLDSTG